MENRIKLLKNSVTVEFVPIIRTERFTKDDLVYLKKLASPHSHYWKNYSEIYKKTWSDEEIKTQLEIYDNISDIDINRYAETLYQEFKYQDVKEDKKWFEEKIKEKLNLTSEVESEFWYNFGSAPLLDEYVSPKVEKYGAVGLKTIFGEEFNSNKYSNMFFLQNTLPWFENAWNNEKRIFDNINTIFSSPFKDLNELEENTVVKKIKEEAKKFYLDKTKDFKERVKAFNEHGEEDGCIYQSNNPILRDMFIEYNERDWIQRNEIVECEQVIENWLEELYDNRISLDFSKNKYHPKLKKIKRNYTPSEKSMEKLYRKYMEILMSEGIAKYKFDW